MIVAVNLTGQTKASAADSMVSEALADGTRGKRRTPARYNKSANGLRATGHGNHRCLQQTRLAAETRFAATRVEATARATNRQPHTGLRYSGERVGSQRAVVCAGL